MYRVTAQYVQDPSQVRFDSYPSRQYHLETHVGAVLVDTYVKHTVAVSPSGSHVMVPKFDLVTLRAGTVVIELDNGRESLTARTVGWTLRPPARRITVTGKATAWHIRHRRFRYPVVEDRRGEVVLGLPVVGRGAELNDHASDLDVTLAVSCWLSRLADVVSPLWGFSI